MTNNRLFNLEECPIQTERLNLAPISASHVDGLAPHMRNPEITQYLAWDIHPDKTFTENVVSNLVDGMNAQTGIHWTLIHNQEVCGLISYIDIRLRHLSWTLNRAELAYWLAPSFQGQGLMTEACKAVLKFGFDACNFNKVVVAHATENRASEKIIKRLGFRFYGEEEEAFQKNGVWHNLKHYQLLKRNFNLKAEY